MIRSLKHSPEALILFLFLAMMTFNGFSQDAHRTILLGQVLNEEQKGLPGASVVIPDLQIGTTTDDDGRFELQLAPQALTMIVSFVGYDSRSIRIEKQELLKRPRFELEVQLVPNTQEIGSAVIVGEKRISVFEESRSSVLDFEFLNDVLLLLISDKRGYRIQICDDEFKPTGAMYLQDKPEGFFKDCFGGIHMRYRYHADELEFVGKNLSVKHSCDIVKFRQLLSPCIAATDEDMYFRITEMSNNRITYFAKNRESKRSKILHVVEEKGRIAAINGTQEHIADLRRRLNTEVFATPSDRLEVQRDIEQYEWFDQAILSQLTYHPLFLFQDSLFMFDHFQSILFVYKDGSLQREVPLEYHFTRDWAKLVLMDEVNGRFYVDIAGSGISVLHHFDRNTGKYVALTVIEDHTFPEKMRVRNNRVWYIHQDLRQEAPALYVIDLPIE